MAPRRSTTPRFRWFVARALAGSGPKLAFLDALLVLAIALIAASLWRRAGGARADFERVVPMVGTALRYSVGLPLAYGAISAIGDDRDAGLIALARTHGISAASYLRRRALGAGLLVGMVVAAPMVVLSLILAGFGGGLEGALARASLVLPSLLVGLGTGAVFGFGAVALGTFVRSRPVAFIGLLGAGALGAAFEGALHGAIGRALRQLISPLRALDDAQAAAFAEPNVWVRGVTGAIALLLVTLVIERIAERAIARELDDEWPTLGPERA
jgi:hypothetical protein